MPKRERVLSCDLAVWRGKSERDRLKGTMFCAYCPSEPKIPQGCPGVCEPGRIDKKFELCHLKLICPCWIRSGEVRFAAFEVWRKRMEYQREVCRKERFAGRPTREQRRGKAYRASRKEV